MHSGELITNHFVLKLIEDILENKEDYLLERYTYHFIPVANPEGNIICTSAIRKLLPRQANQKEEEFLCEF